MYCFLVLFYFHLNDLCYRFRVVSVVALGGDFHFYPECSFLGFLPLLDCDNALPVYFRKLFNLLGNRRELVRYLALSGLNNNRLYFLSLLFKLFNLYRLSLYANLDWVRFFLLNNRRCGRGSCCFGLGQSRNAWSPIVLAEISSVLSSATAKAVRRRKVSNKKSGTDKQPD